jgi:hypothetical protein
VCRELCVRDALTGACTAQGSGESSSHRFELIVASFADEVLLDVAKAGQVLGRFFENGSVPKKGARGVLTHRGIEHGQALVGFSLTDGVSATLLDRRQKLVG